MIYVASSWRNPYQPQVIETIRGAGFKVYDFRHPRPGENGFHWSEIDPKYQDWDPQAFRKALIHPLARAGYHDDYMAMLDSDTFVLVLPCGRSAHLEMGWATGMGADTAVLALDPMEPELMYKLADEFFVSIDELMVWLAEKA